MNQRERDWGPNPTVFNIGGVLSNNESERYFNETISVSKIHLMHFLKKPTILIKPKLVNYNGNSF